MVELDSALREARAREVRHEVVAHLALGTHRVFRVLLVLQWAAALLLAWKGALPGESHFTFVLILGSVLVIPALLFARIFT